MASRSSGRILRFLVSLAAIPAKCITEEMSSKNCNYNKAHESLQSSCQYLFFNGKCRVNLDCKTPFLCALKSLCVSLSDAKPCCSSWTWFCTQKYILLIVLSLGCLTFTVQNDVCTDVEFDTRRLFSHSSAKVSLCSPLIWVSRVMWKLETSSAHLVFSS